MCIIDFQITPNSRQHSVCGIEKSIGRCIVLWSEPLSFHNAPQGFSNVQVWGIWRDVKQEKPSFLPDGTHLSNVLIPMHTGVIKHNECLLFYPKRITVKEIDNLPGINGITRAETFKSVVPVNHPEDIEPLCPLRRYIDIFPMKLPSVRDIPFRADMGLITIKEIYFPFGIKSFKFLQLLGLVLIELRRGDTPWTFSYTSISCANADKKRLNVNSLAAFPLAFCQASLAIFTLCLSASIASRTASSSEQSIIGLRPCPGRVSNPLMPSDLKRLIQLLTLWAVISVCSPTCAELKPSDLSKIARQRIRKQWLSPVRKPRHSSFCSDSVNSNVVIFIRLFFFDQAKIRQFYLM